MVVNQFLNRFGGAAIPTDMIAFRLRLTAGFMQIDFPDVFKIFLLLPCDGRYGSNREPGPDSDHANQADIENDKKFFKNQESS